MIAIIDYNVGNLSSVLNACKVLGVEASIENKPDNLSRYDKIILPGVGAFKDAMEHLKETNMDKAIIQFANSGKPVFGICLGLQLLFQSSEEFGKTSGLGLIDGEVKMFDYDKTIKENLKIPHMGWNKISHTDNKLFDNLNDPYLYFVHSYHIVCDEQYIIGKTDYGYNFPSAVNKDNIFGLQPHPEKSHNSGLQIIKNFSKF